MITSLNTLFDIQPVAPPGFSYFPGFISVEEEKELIREIEKTSLHPLIFQGYEAKRKVESFGYDWDFQHRKLSKGKPIPDGFIHLIKKVASHLSLKEENIGEMLLTEYPVGSVINWHRDAPPFDIILGISLNSDCKFRFRPYDKAKQHRKNLLAIPLERRSLYKMSGESRTEWEHSIPAVKEIRYSITLRTMKENAKTGDG